jgi:hypothetical protein
MKSKYEKELDEFFGIGEEEENYVRYFSEEEDFERWKELLEEHMGNQFSHLENHRAAQKDIEKLSEEIMVEYDKAYKQLAKRNNAKLREDFSSYDRDRLGRFGMLYTREIVRITGWTEKSELLEDEMQEIYFEYLDKDKSAWANFDEFALFAHSQYDLEDNPIKFGDKVLLEDIKVSTYFQLELDQQENYDLYLGKIGLVTQVLHEEHMCLIAYGRDIISMPIFLIHKLYGREITF